MNVLLDPWTETYTGKRMYFLDPQPEMIDIVDIAHSLSMMCRFGGHIAQFYSVAEHCIKVSTQASDRSRLITGKPSYEVALQGLLHDASEAYLMDIPSPIKNQLPEYRKIEDKLLTCIFKTFNVPQNIDLFVSEADIVMLKAEATQLLPSGGNSWKHLYPTDYFYRETLDCFSPKEAEVNYLNSFNNLIDRSYYG